MQTLQTDITIIGAGPAGTSAALSLADSGLKVLLIDQARFPRDKICGDALSGKVFSELNRLIPDFKKRVLPIPTASPSWGIRFFSPSARVLDVPYKQTPSYQSADSPSFVMEREVFDHLLFSAVKEQKSILIQEECRLTQVNKITQGWELDTNTGSIETKLLIDASGATSILAREKYPFKSAPKHLSIGLRQYFRGVSDCQEHGYLELHYLRSVLPGYAWIFPLGDGKVNVGIGMLSTDAKKRKESLSQIFTRFLKHPSIRNRFQQAEPLESPKGFSLPFGSLRRKVSGDHYLMTGDAAGLIDPFTGEGIANAIISGRLAAEQALACFNHHQFDGNYMHTYDQKLFNKIGAELALSHKLQRLGRYPLLLDYMIRKAAGNQAIQQLFTSMFEEVDVREYLSKPSFYLKLLFS
ncbi:MAG: geranylgeranyl reductase family protein [Bacteroidota bacterium]